MVTEVFIIKKSKERNNMKFIKEYIAIIIIVIIIIISDFVTSNIIKKSVQECEVKVNNITNRMLNEENYNEKEVQKEINDLEKRWQSLAEKISFFAEHDELEKVSNEIVVLKANIEINEKENVYESLKEISFKIRHLEQKQKFKLNNVF